MFIALALPAEVLAHTVEEIGRFRKALAFTPCRPRWVEPELLHLTLHFLGNWSTEQMPALRQGFREGCRGQEAAFLEIKQAGVYPHWKSPKVLWFGVRDRGKRLAKLHASLESALIPLGYEPLPRAFSPHLTVARFSGLKGVGLAQSAVAMQPRFQIGPFQAGACGLYQSTLKPEGALHERLEVVELEARPEYG